ncbi:MAG: hypothetical protein KAR42_03670 [candidate division Zixibacteria bacterium]|nr:hypothetical protein [candidate division Zixibacteria bacterium]
MTDFIYELVSAADENQLIREANFDTARVVWPEYMLHDPVSDYFTDLFTEEGLTPYQFAFIDDATDKIILMGNSVPLFYDGDIADLPDRGWDWGLEKCIMDYRAGIKPNMLMAIQVMIPLEYRGKGLSTLGIQAMKTIAQNNGLEHLIAPVRPNMKSKYPLIPFERYIHLTNGDNLPFDGWMRVHSKLGAKIIKPCNHSMEIPGTIEQWETWTGLKFPESGDYYVEGALNSVHMDLENNKGLYIEPNVWMHHKI